MASLDSSLMILVFLVWMQASSRWTESYLIHHYALMLPFHSFQEVEREWSSHGTVNWLLGSTLELVHLVLKDQVSSYH